MNDLAKLFWDHFDDAISSNVPVYFTFHRNLIEDIISENFSDVDRLDALTFFLKEARSFLEVRSNSVRIKNELYNLDKDSFSSAIVLIALQVLAVEEMVVKDNEFTDEAYFPKLRKLISNDLALESSNPFDQKEFDNLWNVFKVELLARSPKTPYVTFDIEKEGQLKNKVKPLSQALLSHRDLLILAEKFYERYSEATQDESIINSTISLNINFLSTRGKAGSRNKYLRSYINNQFQIFLKNTPKESILNRPKVFKKDTSIGVVVSENYDFFLDINQLTIDFEFQDTVNLQRDKAVSLLNQFLIDRKFLILSSFLTQYRGGTHNSEKHLVNDVLFVALNNEFILHLEEELKIRSISNHLYGEIVDTPFKVFKVTDARVSGLSIQQVRAVPSNSLEKSYYFIGGLPLDKRSNHFLSSFLFSGIVINNKKLNSSDEVLLNSVKLPFDKFMRIIQDNTHNIYHFSYGGVSFTIRTSKPARRHLNSYGNLIVKDKLFLEKSFLRGPEKALRGFNFLNLTPVFAFSRLDFLDFFQRDDSRFTDITNECETIVIESIIKSNSLSKIQKFYLERFIKINRKIPQSLLTKARLKAA